MNLSIQDLAAIIVPISALLGFFYKGIDKRFKSIDDRFNKIEKEIKEEFKEVKKDIQNLDRRVQSIEDRLEFSNKVVYIQHEEKKEESK